MEAGKQEPESLVVIKEKEDEKDSDVPLTGPEMIEVNVVLHYSQEHFDFGVVEPTSIFVPRTSLVQDLKMKYFDGYLRQLLVDEEEKDKLDMTWQDFHLLFDTKQMVNNLPLSYYIDSYKPGLRRIRIHALLGTRLFKFVFVKHDSFNAKEKFKDGTEFCYYEAHDDSPAGFSCEDQEDDSKSDLEEKDQLGLDSLVVELLALEEKSATISKSDLEEKDELGLDRLVVEDWS